MVEKPEDNPYIRGPDLDFEDVSEMSKEKARDEIEDLREAIEYHDHLYYIENDPAISDRAYDILFDRLESLEQEFDLVDENSPTQRVGGKTLDSFNTREHTKEMLSLDSSEDEGDVREFDERVRQKLGEVGYSAEPKFDGFSVEIVYLGGEFDRAVMRGDGNKGDEVSKNVKTIRTVPLELKNAPERLSVRGEVYMPKSGFHDLNEERTNKNKDPFANPRNAAAGTIRQLDPDVVADRFLNIYFYEILECSKEINDQKESFELLKSLGFRICDLNEIVNDIDSFIDYRDELMEKREDLEYDIDGAVAKVNDFEKRKEMGETARHPRWAFAYKFPPKTDQTLVEKITVQVGRTGKLTPVALLDPVDIKGVTVSRATLHNEEKAKELGVSEGAKVKIERAGDVIPEIEKVVEKAKGEFTMPESCPVCESDVVKEGEHHFCTGGMSCSAQLKKSIEHFCSKQGLDIEGIGEKVARKLVEEGLVETLPDLFSLEKEDLLELEKFGEKSAENLLEQIEDSKKVDLASFIYGLGIRHVGKERARSLAEKFTLEDLQNADRSEIEEIEDLGPEISKSIHSFFQNERNIESLKRLKSSMREFESLERESRFSGLKIVFTGSIEGYTRDELENLMENHGADVTSSVSSETDFLVTGENPGQSKLESAKDLNTEILDSDEFREKFLEEIT